MMDHLLSTSAEGKNPGRLVLRLLLLWEGLALSTQWLHLTVESKQSGAQWSLLALSEAQVGFCLVLHNTTKIKNMLLENIKASYLLMFWPLREAKPQIMSERWGSLILGLHTWPLCLGSAIFSPSLPASCCSQLGEEVRVGPSVCSTPQSISSGWDDKF